MAALEPVYSYRDPGIRLIHKQSTNSREGAGRAGPNRAARAKLSSATGCYRFCQNRQENQTAEVWGCPPLAVFGPRVPRRGAAASLLRRIRAPICPPPFVVSQRSSFAEHEMVIFLPEILPNGKQLAAQKRQN